ncbi:sugar transferase [Plastorhodobacter daqingensis]
MSYYDLSEEGHRAGVSGNQPGLYRHYGKRLFDLMMVLLAAPLALPLVGLLALLIRRDGGPAFFAQPRVGRDGRMFRCWKLRTMVVDAEAVLAAHLARHPDAAHDWHSRQKLRDDPRITRLGHFLRRTSLDELPQFWNVLRGEMSLIGPRPFTPDQRILYHQGRDDAPYYRMRPGITGPWQVGPRSESAFSQRERYDGAYWQRLSLGLDLLILLRTIVVVLRARGS